MSPYVEVTKDHSVIVRKPWGEVVVCKPTEVTEGDQLRFDGRWFSGACVEDRGVRQEWVYDIGVEDYHTFFANGILVHNSNYLTVHEILQKYFPDKTFDEIALELEERIMNPLIDKLLSTYWNYQSIENIINFKREGVIKDMIILAKKKYIKHIIQNEKKVYKIPEVKYTGVEVVRSDVPRFTRDKLDLFFRNIFTSSRDDKKALRASSIS